jgi:lambda family phage portal protein
MANSPVLLAPDGAPVPAGLPQAVRDMALNGARGPARRGFSASLAGGSQGFVFPYDAASWSTPEMGEWLPQIRSPDGEINLYRNRMVGRQRDLIRNDGWAKGVLGTILDATIGAAYRRISKPDYRRLALFSPGFDLTWAREFGQAADALYRDYAEDLGRYCDAQRRLTMTQMFRLCLGHKLADGESLLLPYWLPDRVGYGAAQYATAFMGVDPDRLSNPYEQMDTEFMRGGIEIDELGVRQAAHIRKAQPNDWYNAEKSMQWERVPFEDPDGFVRVIHDFDVERFGQNRGVSIFAPVVSRLKMLARYYGVELQAATINSIFGAYITSPFDPDLVQDGLSLGPQEAGSLNSYQDLRTAFHEKHKLQLNEARIPILAPGEKIETVAASRPNGEFSPFAHEMLRGVAAALGVSETQVHKDLSSANYSSIRAGLVEAEKTFNRRCQDFNTNTADPAFACWMAEAMERRDLPLPKGAPDFREARNAYSRGRWLGPAAGWVDPVAERQGVVLGLDAGLTTLEIEAARQGLDADEVIDQRIYEVGRFREGNLPMPSWAGEKISAMEAAGKPQPA